MKNYDFMDDLKDKFNKALEKAFEKGMEAGNKKAEKAMKYSEKYFMEKCDAERKLAETEKQIALILLNEQVYIKFMAMYNKEASKKDQQSLAVDELLLALKKLHIKNNKNCKSFRKGDIVPFIDTAEGRMELFTKEQCEKLLSL